MIFGIGLSRTGTTSLHHAFEILGIRSAPTSVALLFDPDDEVLGLYEAFTDNPIPFLYQRLAARFPGSKFILTTRDLDDWLRSMEWLFGEGLDRLDRRTRRLGRQVHRLLYDLRRFDAEVLTEVYRRHHLEVADYFEDRADDLLTIDVTRSTHDPFAAICGFLGRPHPGQPFPHSNAS